MIPNLPSLPLVDADWLFALLMLLVLVVPLIAERLRVPSIVGLVLAGALVGPGGLGLVVGEGAVGTLGTMGLLYLMFLAGLELDLEEFTANRRDSLIFGSLTFVVPMAFGYVSSLLLGFGVLASVLIASCWASHTLLTYPVFRRHGTAGHRAVATSVGGTILTDTAALIVLVVVASAHQGSLSPSFWGLLVLGMAVLLGVTLGLLPRLGRWFFARFGHEQGVRFVFVLAALFGSSALAHLAGIEPIIGAFFAGLALNRLVPNASGLMERVEFVGSNLFIPLFLLSVGLLIDFRLLTDPRTLLTAVAFTAVAVAGKAVAAALAGWWLGYDRTEVGAMFALSNAQAAATLAAIIVGLRIGLIDEEVVNAVVMVILVTCVLASLVAGRIAPRLVRPTPRRTLGSVVMLPVVRPESARPLARIAAAFAAADGGVVIPVTIAVGEDGAARLDELREVNAHAERMARGHGVEADGVVRIDANAAQGVLRTVRERGASLLVMGWHGPDHAAMFARDMAIDPLISDNPTPVLLARMDGRTPRRILVVLPYADRTAGGEANLRLTVEVARRLGLTYRCPVAVLSGVTDPNVLATVTQVLGSSAEVVSGSGAATLRERARADDLVVMPVRADDLRLRAVERLNRWAAASQVLAVAGGVAPAPGRRPGRRRHAEVPLAPLG